MKNLVSLLMLIGIAGILGGCGSASNALLYAEKDIHREEINIKSVAIVPNQLPLNLTEPEKWRQYNWGIMNKRFTDEGYKVVDYATSVSLFEHIGLPLVDTKASIERYEELALEIGADLIVVPYYNTGFLTRGITDKTEYLVNGTLWFFLPGANDFMARVDFDGSSYYYALTKLSLPFMLGMGAAGAYGANELEVNSYIGWSAGLLPAVYTLTIGVIKGPERRYQDAFKLSINDALDQFFGRYK